MYKMKLLSKWGGELRWCKILHCDAHIEAMILATEKLKLFFTTEKVYLCCVTMYKYMVFVDTVYTGHLTVKGI